MTLVVLNPHARGGRARDWVEPLQHELAQLNAGARLVVPANAQDARALVAREAPGSRIIVVGGDGTLHQLLPALLAGDHVTGLVAAGSGDDSARALALRELPWRRGLAHALTAPASAVDVGEVQTEHEQRPFFSSLAGGFDAAVAQRALTGPGWLAGLPRYLLATLQEVAALRLHELSVTLDGQRVHQGPALFASSLNTRSYGGGMPAVPTARIDDGRLDLLLAARFSRSATLAMLPRLLLGQHLSHPQVRCLSFVEAHIEAAALLPLAADGEAMRAAQHVVVRVRATALRVVAQVPA